MTRDQLTPDQRKDVDEINLILGSATERLIVGGHVMTLDASQWADTRFLFNCASCGKLRANCYCIKGQRVL